MYRKLILITLCLTFLLPTIAWANNEAYPAGQLVEIKHFVKSGNDKGFQIDLTGAGEPQNVNIQRINMELGQVTISQGDNVLFDKRIQSGRWFSAYLRDNGVPELVHLTVAGSGMYLNDFEVIGVNDSGNISALFTEESLPRNNGMKNPRILLQGKVLYLYYDVIKDISVPKATRQYNHYHTGIYWSKAEKRFIVLPITSDN